MDSKAAKKETKTPPAPPTVAEMVLAEKKSFRGKDFPAGTVLGEIRCKDRFIVEDIDLSSQLGQVKIVAKKEQAKQSA